MGIIEFPIFTGDDLRQWISWLEDFFVQENFTALEKLNLAHSLLEGEANAWFYNIRKRFVFQSWEHLVDHLIWKFGDFSDPELLLLFDKNDRLLQKQIDDAKLRRMSRTAITPQESISSPATIPETITVDKFSNQVDEISAEKKESKKEVDLSLGMIASQLKLPNTKVHVSDSENLRNIETRIGNSVLDNFETVVKETKIQKNIRMDVVNGDVERIQRVRSISKNVSAHQVLDKMCQLKRLKPKNKKKLSLSLKTWMFKFKHKILLWSRSQTDPHQAMDSSIIKYISSSSRDKFGYKWKEHNSKHWRRMRQTHMSRLLCNLRVRQDPRGLEQLILDDLKSHMRHKWKSKHLRAVYLQTNLSYALDVVNKPVAACKNDRVIATALGRQAVLDQITKGLEMKKQMKVLKSWMFKYKPATSSSMLPLYVNQMGVSDIQDNDNEMVADPVTQAVLNLVTNAARFGLVSVLIWLTVLRVLWLCASEKIGVCLREDYSFVVAVDVVTLYSSS